MKTLMVLRLAVWSILLSLCVTIIAAYFVTSQTLLNQSQLTKIARDSDIYTTIRDDAITPQLVSLVNDAGYSNLVEEALVSDAVKKSFADDTLETLLQPALVSFGHWLDSKEAKPEFTIDVSKPLQTFTTTVADEWAQAYMTLPECTYLNSYEDIERAICRVPGTTPEQLREQVQTLLRDQPLVRDAKLTSEYVNLPSSLVATVRHLPQYISALYAASIFAAGISFIIIIRLLFKYRFIGLAVVGIGGLLASIQLLVATVFVRGMPSSITLDDTYQVAAKSLVDAFVRTTFSVVIPLAAIGFLCVIVGLIGWRTARRRTHTSALHLSDHTDDLPE